MSTPKSMQLTENESATTIKTSRVEHAALVAKPNGEPIGTALLVHGFTGSKEDFIHLLPALAERGWHAVAIDQRGCYQTSGSDDELDYTLENFSLDLLEIIASFNKPIHLLGHSFGGLVAQAAAIAGANLASLTLFCSGPGAIPGTAYDWLHEFQADLRSGHKDKRINESIEEMKSDGRLSSASVEHFLRERWAASKTAALLGKANVLINQADLSNEVANLATAGLPVLVTHGVDDDAWPIAQQAQMAKTIGAQYEIIPDSAHSPNVENVSGTTEVLDHFWRSLL
jgi:pimeloyl-ACP methyl ester carboxylesterase